MDQCAVVQQQKMDQQVLEQQQHQKAMEQQQQQQLEQHNVLEQQQQQQQHIEQHQQQQQWTDNMGQAYYTQESVDGNTNFQTGASDVNGGYNNANPGGDAGPSLGVYTPDSSTNSVHSLHGYADGGQGVGHDFQGVQTDQQVGEVGEAANQQFTQHTPPASNQGVGAYTGGAGQVEQEHNSSIVIQSPSSISSVEPGLAGYTSEQQACSQQTQALRGVHPLPGNSPGHSAAQQSGVMAGVTLPVTPGQSPHNPASLNQSPTAMNLPKQSPIHVQQSGLTSQSPHPIQSPHPPMQPSPHTQQSSPHPPIANYTSVAQAGLVQHQSQPQPPQTPVFPQQPVSVQQQQQASSGSRSSKSPRGSSSGSRGQSGAAAGSSLQAQQQHSMRQLQQANQYYQSSLGLHRAAQAQQQVAAQAQAAGVSAGQVHAGVAEAAAFNMFSAGASMFPPSVATSQASKAFTAPMDSQQAAVAHYYGTQQAVAGHTMQSQANSLVRLQQLTQGLDPLGLVPASASVPGVHHQVPGVPGVGVASHPAAQQLVAQAAAAQQDKAGNSSGQRQTSSKSKSRSGSQGTGQAAATAAHSLAAAAGLPPGYPSVGMVGGVPGYCHTPAAQGAGGAGVQPGQASLAQAARGAQAAQAAQAAAQSRPPNVTINPTIMQHYVAQQHQFAQYNAMLNTPGLMYGTQYDPQRSSGQVYSSYPYNMYR